MDNNEFDYKRLGARIAGGASGLGASEYMFRNTNRGATLSKHKFIKPFVGAYSVLQGQHIGNKLYNVSGSNNAIQKQAEFIGSRTQGPVYGNDPNINYQEHPSKIPNMFTNAATTVGGTALGAGMGHLAKSTFRTAGFKGPGMNMVTAAMPLAGAYLGYKASSNASNAQNAYTAYPNV
jgi:hypothetical protein